MSGEDFNAVLADVMANYPEEQWLEQAEKRLPAGERDALIAAIEIEVGGDVVSV